MESDPHIRVDKWLWAARFFKTRALAVDAIGAGRVSVSVERSKPAKLAKVGDRLQIRRPPFEHAIVVKSLADKRCPAAAADALFDEPVDGDTSLALIATE